MQKAAKITAVVLLSALFVLFIPYALSSESPLGLFAAALSLALFGGCLAFFVPRFFTFLTADEPPAPDALLGARSLRFSKRHPWARIAFFTLAFRLFLLALAWGISTYVNGYEGGIWNTFERLWLRSDSPSYMGIAQNWYVTAGDAQHHIVFFPFFPVLIRAFSWITGTSFSAAMLLNTLCTLGAAVYFYELCALELPRKKALDAVKYLFLLPGAFFFIAPMTESLFFLLCVASVYYLRKKRVFVSALLAALAGFTRSAGILLALPMLLEGAFSLAALLRINDKKGFKAELTRRVLALFIVPLGLLGYLLINYAVWGDMFKFLAVQSDHWSQGFGSFFHTAAYQLRYALDAVKSGDVHLLWGLFLPNLLASFSALFIMLLGAKKLRPSYTLYFLAYFAFSIGVTWLLSAPRYLAAAFPLPLALAHLTDRAPIRYALMAVLLVLQAAYLAMYVLGWPVY